MSVVLGEAQRLRGKCVDLTMSRLDSWTEEVEAEVLVCPYCMLSQHLCDCY
jgi:hypothetical protein